MSSYAGDDEQLEALKRWWKENGSSLISGVLIVVVAWFGFGQFQQSRENSSAAASALYDQISQLALANLGGSIGEDDLLAAQAWYSELKNDHASSIYVRYAALFMAGFHVQQDQLERAAAELQWVLDNPDIGFLREADPELFTVARLRLARVQLGLGNTQAALALLQAEPASGPFRAVATELEGDIQMALGNRDAARTAYESALLALMELGTGNPGLLQLKLQDLGVDPAGML